MLTGFNFLDFFGLVFLYFPLYCYLDSFFWCAVLEGITSSAASHQGFHSLLVKRGAGPIRARPYGAETGGTHWFIVPRFLYLQEKDFRRSGVSVNRIN